MYPVARMIAMGSHGLTQEPSFHGWDFDEVSVVECGWDVGQQSISEWVSKGCSMQLHSTQHLTAATKGRPVAVSQASQSQEESVLEFWFEGEANGTPLQYSCLENPMGGGPGRLQSMGL